MKQNMVAGVGLVIALVVVLAGLFVVPALQDAQRTVDSQAAEQVEYAYRLLSRYDAQLGRSEGLLAELRGFEDLAVDVDLDEPDELVEAAGDRYQEEYEANWEDHPPKNPDDLSQDAGRPRFGNLAGQIREGIAGRDALLDENAAILNEAQSAAEEALNLSVGDASSRDYVEAHRILATIHYLKGLAAHAESLWLRREIEPYRREVALQARQLGALQARTNLVEQSMVGAQIAELNERVQAADAQIAEEQVELGSLDQEIAGLEERLADARERTRAARSEMEALEAEGIDLTAAEGAAQFATAYQAAAKKYRKALSDAAALEFGSYANAQIDESGDYLTGAYVPAAGERELTIEHGLRYYVDRHTVLAAKLEGHRAAVATLQEDLKHLERMQEQYAAEQQQAQAAIAEARSLGQEAFDLWKQAESEAEAEEESVLALFEQSAAAARDAASYAEQRIGDAREALNQVSDGSRDLSPHQQAAGDQWVGGFIGAQQADAQLASAWIYYDQFRDRLENARVLGQAAEILGLKEASADDERAAATEAQEIGVELISEVIASLEQAHRDTGRHWTITAQAAGAKYLIVLFGDSRYAREVVDGYRAAIQDRAEEDFVAPYVRRIEQLTGRTR